MSVLHILASREWRGGENQVRFLLENLPAEWLGELAVTAGSPAAQRLSGLAPIHEMPLSRTSFGSIFKLRKILKSGRFSLIHAHTSRAHDIAELARFKLDVPLLVSRRNAYPASASAKYRSSAHFVTISSAGAAQLQQAGVDKDRLSIIADSVDPAAKPTGTSQLPIAVCIADFAAEKDHETLLNAWHIVESEKPKAKLVLVGNGDDTPLKAQAAQLGLRSLELRYPVEDLPALLSNARIAVLSSREEGLGSALCLAQTMGLPVAATDAGGIPDAVADGETGLLSPVGDATSLAASILSLLDPGKDYDEMSQKAAKRAAKLFDAKLNAAAHVALYERLASA